MASSTLLDLGDRLHARWSAVVGDRRRWLAPHVQLAMT
jgi:hypothetical protein